MIHCNRPWARHARSMILTLSVVVLFPGQVLAVGNIIEVPYDYTTIQAALTYASEGATIKVYQGTYAERLTFPSCNVTLTSENGERKVMLDPCTRDSSYWRDVGTLDAYWNANMDLTGVDPHFNLYGKLWPIHTYQLLAPPAKFIFSMERHEPSRVGKALDSLVAPGCIVSGVVRNSVLSYNVVVQSWASVDESVILDDVVVGRNCKIKKAIVDKHNIIPHHTEIGYQPEEDRKRFTVTPRGIVVVPMGYFS